MAHDLSVVVPVFRNARTLDALYRRLSGVLRAAAVEYEILFVDDASPDASLAALRSLAAADPRVGVIQLHQNVGQNRAVLIGLQHARGARAVVMDADLQDPPEAIPRLLEALQPPVSAVFGGRRGRYESPFRLATSKVFKTVLHRASQRRIPADAGLFVAMGRVMIERLAPANPGSVHVLAMMGRTGLPMRSVPVERAPSRESSYTSLARLGVAWTALAGSRSCPPARVRAYFGAPFQAQQG